MSLGWKRKKQAPDICHGLKHKRSWKTGENIFNSKWNLNAFKESDAKLRASEQRQVWSHGRLEAPSPTTALRATGCAWCLLFFPTYRVHTKAGQAGDENPQDRTDVLRTVSPPCQRHRQTQSGGRPGTAWQRPGGLSDWGPKLQASVEFSHNSLDTGLAEWERLSLREGSSVAIAPGLENVQ